MPKLREMTVAEILALHVQIGEELRARGVSRSANNPVGDLSERLFCSAFGWEQAPNSERGYDARDSNKIRYQIKGRRIHRRTKSRQLSAIRNLTERPFDVLAGVLFEDDYKVLRAALIPWAVVNHHSTYQDHTNSYIFQLRDEVWQLDGVRDMTDRIKDAMDGL